MRRALAVAAGLAALALALWFSRPGAPAKVPAARTASAADAGAPPAPAPLLHGPRTLEGVVQDDRGKPLTDALVRVSDPASNALPREVHTDERGQFRVDDLPAAPLLVEVTRAGHEGKEHTLSAEDAQRLVFMLARQGELLVALRDAPGRPVDGSAIVLTGPSLWPAQEARASAEGESVFKGLPAGEYRVRARREARIAVSPEPVSVVPGQRTKVELVLVEGARLSGVVLERETRKPLPGARIAIQDLTPGVGPVGVLSNEQGAFEVEGLWPGTVRVDVQLEGYAASPRDLSLPFGERLELALSGAARISGVVVDERGHGIAGARLSVATQEGLPIELATGGDAPPKQEGAETAGELGITSGPVPAIPRSGAAEFALGTLAAESDAEGRFRIAQLAPAPLALYVARAGFVSERLIVGELKPHGEKTDLRVVLRDAGRVSGRVVDARGRALSSVYVAARSSAGDQSTVTDEQGQYTLRDLLGEVTVEAQPDGHTALSCRVVVRARDEARCDLAAEVAVHELPVRVVDEYGFGLEGALVAVRAPGAARAARQLSRRDGSLLLRELPAPPYALEVTLAGYLSVHDLKVAQVDRELRVQLARAGNLSGFVLDALGRAVPHAFVSTEEGEASAESDGQGTFMLAGVAPGTHALIANHPQAGNGRSAEVRARPGERLDGVRIVLGGRYRGDDDGESTRAAGAPAPRESERDADADYVLEQRGRVLVVTRVAQTGPAAKAGLRSGDVLAAVDGEPALSAAHARGLLRDPPGKIATVRVLRNQRAVNLRYRRPAL